MTINTAISKIRAIPSARSPTCWRSHIDLKEVLSLAARRWDGGYVMAGMIGHGDAFVMRDPCGIRPALLLSGRRGGRGRIGARGDPDHLQRPVRKRAGAGAGPCTAGAPRRGCVRSNRFTAPQASPPLLVRTHLFLARQRPGHLPRTQAAGRGCWCRKFCKASTTTSKIRFFPIFPNTAESAFFGLVEGLDAYCAEYHAREKIHRSRTRHADRRAAARRSCGYKPRVEKDGDQGCQDADVHHAGQRTRRPGGPRLRHHLRHDPCRDADNLVILDDSIVRGTTLRQQHHPDTRPARDRKKIVVCSSAPADPLSGLLRDRHVATGRLRRIPGRDRTAAQGARHACM